MTSWARIANTTIKDYLREEEDAVSRNRVIYGLAKSKGRVTYNHGGDGVNWKVRYRRNALQTNNGEQTVEFNRYNRNLSADLDWAGYIIPESITKREKLQNRGTPAIIKFVSDLTESMTEDFQDGFAEEFYVDSSATGNSQRWSGLETMYAINGTVTITSGAQRTANAADLFGYPNDTYAGLSTVLGNYGGSWGTQSARSSTWPLGRGSADYDFWSPAVLNYTSTALGGSVATWAIQCESAIRTLVDSINKRQGANSQVDLVIVDRDLYTLLKEREATRQSVVIEKTTPLKALGFTDSIDIDGVEVTAEYGMPAGVGYALSMKHLEIMSMQEQLLMPDMSTFDQGSRTFRYAIDCLGQFKFKSPRSFGKLAALA